MGLFPFRRKGLGKGGAAFASFFLSASLLLLPIPQGLDLGGGRGTATGTVLCIGPAGHVALEPGLGGRCCPGTREIPAGIAGSPSAPPVERGGFTGGSHCGRCIDLPITGAESTSLHSMGSRRSTPSGKAFPAGPAPILAIPDALLRPSRALEGAPREEKNRPAALLDTVVLLI